MVNIIKKPYYIDFQIIFCFIFDLLCNCLYNFTGDIMINNFDDYFFPNQQTKRLREKYFDKLLKILNAKNFACEKYIDNEFRYYSMLKLLIKTYEFINKSQKTRKEFIDIYGIKDVFDLSQLVLDALVYQELKKYDIDIYLNIKSVLFIGKYPISISIFLQNKNESILDFAKDIQSRYELTEYLNKIKK